MSIVEELPGGNRALALWSGGAERRVEGEEHSGQVRRGIGVRDVAANRAAVADLRVADLSGRLREDRTAFGKNRRRGELCMSRQRADPDRVAGCRDALQRGNPSDVDERRWRCKAQLEQRDQAVSAREHFRVRVFGPQLLHLGERSSAVIVE
jgi:hypothetical protein